MRGWALAAALVFAGLLALVGPVDAEDAPAVAKPFHVIFIGYQVLNGQVLVQLHVSALPAADQPGLLKTGDRVDLGSLGTFTVGKFQEEHANVVNPATGQPVNVDVSKLDLIDDAGRKTVLQFRRATEVKPSPGKLTQARPADARDAATA